MNKHLNKLNLEVTELETQVSGSSRDPELSRRRDRMQDVSCLERWARWDFFSPNFFLEKLQERVLYLLQVHTTCDQAHSLPTSE